MKLNIKFFATLKEKAQTTHLIVDLEDQHLTVLYGICWLKNLPAKNRYLNPSDEIALFPPVSGGIITV